MSRLYEGKTFLKMRRILAVFIAPIFLFQMLSIHMLLIAVSSVRAEEISDNSAGIIQAAEEEKTDKDDLKIEEEPAKDEKLDAEKVEEVEKEQEREKDADIPAVEKDELDEENGVDSEVDTLDNKNDTEDVAVSDPVVEDEKSSESKEEESLKSEEDSLEEDKTEQPSGDQELAEENSVNDQNVVDDEKSLEEYSEGNIVPVGPAIDPEAASIEKIQPTDFIGNPLDLLEGRDDMQMSKTESMSTWSLDGNIAVTNAPVELGKKYVAPQNSEVSVTFTKLPNDPGTLTIEEIKLSPAQVKILHAASDIAYDITSSMSNGTFEYDLTLPVPRDITGSVGVKYSESISKLDSAKSVSGQIEQGSDAVDVEGMDHFTLFVVTNDSGMLSDIISSAGPNGSISPEGTMSFPVGGSITYDILPNAGYFISDVIVDGVSIGTVPSYSFTNIEISHSIQAIFAVDSTAPVINALNFAGRNGVVSGGNTVDIYVGGLTDPLGSSSIDVSEPSVFQITSPIPGLPVSLTAGNNSITIADILGVDFTAAQLMAILASTPGNTLQASGTLTDTAGNVTNITISITTDDAEPPTINTFIFANHTGIVTGGNTIDINLSGVTDADLASVGNINVSEDSTLQITSPMTNGPISLTAGDNNLGTVDVFGYNILASELRATALLYGGLIPVQGTLTDVFGNVTNIAINITVDVTAPTINALSFANRTGTVTGGNTVALDLSGVSDADLASAGSIDVSENSTLEIASPTPTGPINLTAGSNTLTTVDIFGYNILASELRATAILFGGLIPVTGTLTDENGNTTNITINILFDIVPPVITLLGSNVVDIEYGSTYIDAGATAFDDHDGDITGNIIIVNPVDTSVLGSYLVTYDVTDANGNNATQVTRTVNVVPRAITVTADSETKVFGTSDPALTYQITSGSLVGTDTFTGALTRDPGEDVGTYAITQGTLALSSNYNLTFVGNDLTITQADITVTADPQTKVYGQADPALTYQITSGGLVGTDTFTGALTRDPGEDVGTYAIKQGTLALNSNYNITFVGNFITITPAQTVIKHNHHHDDDDDNDDDDDDNDGAELFSLLPIMPQYQTGLEGGPIMSDDQSETQDQPSFVEGADAMSEDVLPPETEVPAKKFSWAWWVVIAAVIGALGWRLLRFLVARRYEN